MGLWAQVRGLGHSWPNRATHPLMGLLLLYFSVTFKFLRVGLSSIVILIFKTRGAESVLDAIALVITRQLREPESIRSPSMHVRISYPFIA